MHIEVFLGAGSTPGNQQWYWRFRNKGRVTGNNEDFPTKANAVRAAKGVVTAVGKRMGVVPAFWKETEGTITIIKWN
jgi:hypothetical protein